MIPFLNKELIVTLASKKHPKTQGKLFLKLVAPFVGELALNTEFLRNVKTEVAIKGKAFGLEFSYSQNASRTTYYLRLQWNGLAEPITLDVILPTDINKE